MFRSWLLTAKDEVSDKVRGLDAGADDYMTKPFSQEELLARLRAILRRQGDVVFDEMKYLDLALNVSSRLLRCGEKSVHLAYKEFEILRMLIRRPGCYPPQRGHHRQGLGRGYGGQRQQCRGIYLLPA